MLKKAEVTTSDYPCRRKYWSEMNDTEKIEELIRELQSTQNSLRILSEYVTKLVNHDHKKGKMITLIEHPCNENYRGFYFKVYKTE